MIIGNFNYDAKADTYEGVIRTLTLFSTQLHLRPIEKSGDKEPDYRIVAETSEGTIEVGAAWKRKSEKGQDFLSVSMDDPGLSYPLNAALFRSESGDSAVLVWNRKKPGGREHSFDVRLATTAKPANPKAK